jgi:hypothetical protein
MLNNQYIFYIIDRARTGSDMGGIFEYNVDVSCLYIGESAENLADYAPYLINLTDDLQALDWLLNKCYGDNWGIFIYTKISFEKIYKHFRKFLIVQTEEGKELYFRFYDPRVLRVFLPTCDSEQLKEFFGPIDYFLVESENPDILIKFFLENNELNTENIETELIFKNFSTNYIQEIKTDVLSSNNFDLNIV